MQSVITRVVSEGQKWIRKRNTQYAQRNVDDIECHQIEEGSHNLMTHSTQDSTKHRLCSIKELDS